jgi:hypothetical protein
MIMEWGIAFGKNAGLRTCDIAATADLHGEIVEKSGAPT